MRYFRFIFSALILWNCSQAYAEQVYNIAIYNFTAKTIEAVEITGPIDSALRSVFSKRGNIEVISRRAMEDKLKRLNVESSDQLASIVRSGSSLGVDYVIAGSISANGAHVQLEYGLYDVKNGALRLKIKKVGSSNADIYSETESVVAKFVVEFGRRFERNVKPELASFAAKAQAGRIKLSWSIAAANRGQQVKVYRASSARGPFTYIGESTRSSYRDLRPNPDQNYYQLALVAADGSERRFNTTASSVITTKKKALANLFPPTIVSAAFGINSIELKFLASLRNKNIADHRIYQRLLGASEWQAIGTLATAAGVSEYLFSKSNIFQSATDYEFAVSARTPSQQESAYSASSKLQSTAAPQVTVNGEAMLRRIELNWNQVDLAKGYKVYRQLLADSEWQQIATIKRNTTVSYTDQDSLQDGTGYRYYIAAFDSAGESAFKAATEAITKAVPTAIRAFLVVANQVKRATLSWSASSDPDVAGYAIYRQELSQSESFERIAFIKGATKSDYEDNKNLADGSRYSYKMAAENTAGGLGDYSEVMTITTKLRPQPGRFFAAAAIDSTIELQWHASPNQDIASYQLQRQWAGQQWQRLATLEAGQLTYSDGNLKPYRSVSYRLMAVDIDDLSSDVDSTVAIENPVAVELQLVATDLLRRAQLSWNKQYQITAFNLYRSEAADPDNWQKIRKLRATATDYTDKAALQDGRVYRYKLLAVDDSGELPSSNIVSAATKDLPPPPLDFTVTSGLLKSVAIAWTAAADSDVGGYQIYRAIEGGELESYQRVKGFKRASYLDKGSAFNTLKDQQRYSYQIAAYNTFGAQGAVSELLTAKTMVLPARVNGLAAAAVEGAVSVSWALSADATVIEFIVYRATDSECKKLSKLRTVPAKLAAFDDLDIDPNKRYCYGVVAKNAAGLLSAMSDTKTAN
ncbi:MAG: fibronectin type 3 domain-containing protein/TolB-like protein [Paraglaciecola psychrophila]|jgi:fibronectin type 3 domain-containing protein/TolB-like protein